MTCPGCGAPDDAGCYRNCPMVNSPEYGLTQDGDSWLFTDWEGTIWRLRPSHLHYFPFEIYLERRGK